jgi:hypothetical protein
MNSRTTLRAKQINYGQSEIWLEADGKELTPRRTLATNEVINVTRRLCVADAFEAFNQDYHAAVGHIASLTQPNLNDIASELKLKA